MSSSNFKSEKIINIDNSVTVRKVHFNEDGLVMLSKIRRFLEDRYFEHRGEDVKFSLPATIHLMMQEYIELLEARGHNVNDPDGFNSNSHNE